MLYGETRPLKTSGLQEKIKKTVLNVAADAKT
jgi:hypothetical protein